MEPKDKVVLEMNEFKNINSGREVFYNFLSRSYKKEVDEEYLEMLETLLPYIENMTAKSEIEQFQKGGKLIGEFINKLKGLDTEKKKELMLDLSRDFTYIFLIGSKSVPNSESVYLSPSHLIKQEPRDEVLKIYRKVGFKISEDLKGEPEDHIASELEFTSMLSHLVCKSIDNEDNESMSKYLNYQKEFIEEHLNKWIPKFCEFIIRTKKKTGFYDAIAYLTEGFILSDREIGKEAFSVKE